jgi:hypothetical protein
MWCSWDIAIQGGLRVTDTEILDSGPAPVAPQALPAGSSALPHMAHAHDAVGAQQDCQRKVTVFTRVKEADSANGILDGMKKTPENSLLEGSFREAVQLRGRVHQWCCRQSDRAAQRAS